LGRGARRSEGVFARITSVVSRIPRGRVATYGQVARLANLPGQARLVGYALAALRPESRVPWHRVVNAQGRVSIRRDGGPESHVQQRRLQREGVAFDASGAIALKHFRWRPRPRPGAGYSRSTSIP
jgi:methylated-DNA-protein-cysteine methyltransferase related protein